MKTDRRVKYTKTLLRSALIEMMQTQHISGISIKALCELADVNRSTFYAHYSDQYDLLHQMEQELLDDLRGYLERQEDSQSDIDRPISAPMLESILRYVKENADLFKALLSEHCDFAFQKDVMVLAQIVTARTDLHPDKRLRAYAEEFGITGCISIIYKWLADGMVESPEEMAEFILKIAFYGPGQLFAY